MDGSGWLVFVYTVLGIWIWTWVGLNFEIALGLEFGWNLYMIECPLNKEDGRKHWNFFIFYFYFYFFFWREGGDEEGILCKEEND
jgi:hypothetical protein